MKTYNLSTIAILISAGLGVASAAVLAADEEHSSQGPFPTLDVESVSKALFNMTESNSKNISVNTARIDNSRELITGNQKNIQFNAGNIKQIESDLHNSLEFLADETGKYVKRVDTRAGKLKTAITANKNKIDANKDDIETMGHNIDSNEVRTAHNKDFIKNNAKSIDLNNSNIKTNKTAIATNSKNIARVDQRVDSLAAETKAGYNKLDNKIDHVSNRANAGVAAAFAAASLPQNYAYKYNVGVAAANYRDQQALAVGFQYKIKENLVTNTNVAIDTYSGVGVAAGISFGW